MHHLSTGTLDPLRVAPSSFWLRHGQNGWETSVPPVSPLLPLNGREDFVSLNVNDFAFCHRADGQFSEGLHEKPLLLVTMGIVGSSSYRNCN
ncbi:hypothetical protein AVEN_150957-1 [Araneus ventricosus]|uniref:Uncharacterized protein n=1 Tax=Araneus ventricosus TaxID=182803 RepID=A0A4Y2X498_ARAVE|nr:hypothetical protein AVEN_150957-1 [Araneus ventricosus]